MKKKTYVLGMAVMLAAVLALSGVAQSAMWVGAELGPNFVSANLKAGGSGNGVSSFSPTVVGGLTLGYDFVNAGFGAYAWPDWMKYFSVATDITYNRLTADLSRAMRTIPNNPASIDGRALVWTFLFMAHYGFMPDSEVPSGRINPYIGVGPAIVFSGVDFSVPAPAAGFAGTRANVYSTNVALVVEPGIRWVVLPNVSVDTSFRWRYCAPSYSTSNVSVSFNPLNQFSFLLRANYHF
jgi:hypothetical protein